MGRWRRLHHTLLLGPYDRRHVRLIGARLADVNSDTQIEITASFRVSPRATVLANYTFTTGLQQTRPRQPSFKPMLELDRSTSRLPDQGVYEECAPSLVFECLVRLQQIAAAGFRVVLNYTAWSGTVQEIQTYADEAGSLGLKLIWPLNAVAWRTGVGLRAAYPELAGICQCSTDSDLMRFAITVVAHNPATWGYYIADEVNISERALVGRLASTVRSLAPALPLLAVVIGHEPQSSQALAALAPYVDVLGADYYPIGTGVPITSIGDSVRMLHHISAVHGIASVAVLQAFSWGQYPAESPATTPRWPTRAEMRLERTVALSRGNPGLILWYSFYDVRRSQTPNAHWADLTWSALGP